MFRVDSRFKTDKQILIEFYSHHRVMAAALSFENIETGNLHNPEHTCRLTLPAVSGFRGEVVTGKARQKKQAEQAASAEALKVLVLAGLLQFSSGTRPQARPAEAGRLPPPPSISRPSDQSNHRPSAGPSASGSDPRSLQGAAGELFCPHPEALSEREAKALLHKANKEIENLRSQLAVANGGTIASRMRALDDS